VILFRDHRKPLKDGRLDCLVDTMELAKTLEESGALAPYVRELRFVESWLEGGCLRFEPAGTKPAVGDPLCA
jgi:hypothetical protein